MKQAKEGKKRLGEEAGAEMKARGEERNKGGEKTRMIGIRNHIYI